MSDIKLFHLSDNDATELTPSYANCEKDLQTLIELRMKKLFGIRFLDHEHSTGKLHRGYIDSLGLDENNCPVIVEYKRRGNENIISQALYYLDWLLDHQGDFLLLAKNRLGREVADQIEFSGARIICVAYWFSRFDERAIMQIDKNIELIRYKFFAPDLLLLELVNNAMSRFFLAKPGEISGDGVENFPAPMPPAMRSRLLGMSGETEAIYLELLEFAKELGEDVSIKFLKHYIALTRLRNFACVQPRKTAIHIYLNLDPESITLEENFSRDVRNVGHNGSGNLELELRSRDDLAKAGPIMRMAYEMN